jgi:hypothetical protein
MDVSLLTLISKYLAIIAFQIDDSDYSFLSGYFLFPLGQDVQ